MKYLSFDLEATGLREKDLIIEFAMIPFSTEDKSFNQELCKHYYIKCPSFDELKENLDPWVVEHNETLIRKAHSEGIGIPEFKKELEEWLASPKVREYFELKDSEKITLFGKSINAIDLPFLNRDLGHEFMRKHFNHQTLDLSSVVMGMVDSKRLPKECLSGSYLNEHFLLGEVAHTALEDAISTAMLYLKILDL